MIFRFAVVVGMSAFCIWQFIEEFTSDPRHIPVIYISVPILLVIGLGRKGVFTWPLATALLLIEGHWIVGFIPAFLVLFTILANEWLKERYGAPPENDLQNGEEFLPGIRKEAEGDLTFELTDDEKKAVDSLLDELASFAVHADHADEIYRGAVAFALSNYAKEKIAEYTSSNDSPKLHAAISSIGKAYSIYPIPIFMYELGLYMDMAGKHEQARGLYAVFLEKQTAFEFDPISKLLVSQQYVESAVEDAKSRCA